MDLFRFQPFRSSCIATHDHNLTSQVITSNEDSCSSDCVPPGSIIKIKNISTGSNADASYKSTGIVRHTTQ